MPTDTETAIVIIAVIVGVILRTLVPYLKAAAKAEKAGTPITFQWKYGATAVLTLILTAFTALEALSAVTIPEANGWQGMITIFLFGVSYAYAFQSTLNLAVEINQG